jgi:hypothetical protein
MTTAATPSDLEALFWLQVDYLELAPEDQVTLALRWGKALESARYAKLVNDLMDKTGRSCGACILMA